MPEIKNNMKDPKWCPNPYWKGRGHWRWHGVRPPRHWFFMRIFFLFFWVCVIWIAISLFSNGSFSLKRVPHYLGWALLVMAPCFFMLKRMFRPLRMLLKGVKEVSEGNLDFQFEAKGRHGEIHYLAESFNLMVQRIREMVQSKDQLLLDVSHELRSPLTRLKVALEMTPKGKMKDSMLRDVSEMETMITEILETERLKNGNGKLALGPVDLDALARETQAKFKSRKPGVKIAGKPKALVIQADEARVKTVLQNVLENALKYSMGRKKPVEIHLSQDEKEATLAVQDFGQGIPPEDQEKVFEPFYRVDKSRTKDTGGYGLGLSLCREIMLAHGGDIRLQSEPGQGTKVTLYFSR
ncbi:MAG TPA: HAMP domain-containing sensor histidine kinase [bacterium]|jgi:signal transduction histidine kinase|nr:HAMP domain-containing sensor histidine kinase [bacterium]